MCTNSGRHFPQYISGFTKCGNAKRRHNQSAAIKRRSRCGILRGNPVLNSHFAPGAAPHVGQRIASDFCPCSFFLVLAFTEINHAVNPSRKNSQYCTVKALARDRHLTKQSAVQRRFSPTQVTQIKPKLTRLPFLPNLDPTGQKVSAEQAFLSLRTIPPAQAGHFLGVHLAPRRASETSRHRHFEGVL